nr:PREDICTED: uncharacterized protein LOC108217594 [Daucus carota subsp. sativus]
MGEQPAAATDTKALKAFSEPKINDVQSTIVSPAIAAKTFEIKPGTIQMVRNSVQFGGAPTEDLNMHIQDFIEICDTFKFNGSITTWEDLAQNFLTKFFPMAKTAAIRNSITQFSQPSVEILCEPWERYKEMLRKCPHHGMLYWMVINCLYNGLGPRSRPMLDAASGGALWAKINEVAYELIEMMAANDYQNPTQRLHQGKAAGILDVDATTAIAAQLKALTMKMDSLANLGVQQPPTVCEICAGTHSTYECAISSESAQFVSNFQSDTNANPGKKEVKEQVQAITLRSGKDTKKQESAVEQNKEESNQQEETPVLSSESESGKNVVGADLNKSNVEESKDSPEKSAPKHDDGVKQVYPPPPYPKRLQKQKLDKQFAKFLEVFKKLQIKIPFAEALQQMSSYAKFMKDILSRKLKLEELETVALTEECSTVLQQKLSPKLKDPGSFTIPCTIGKLSFDKLTRRIDVMHDIHRRFDEDLTQALGSAFRAFGVEVDWSVFGAGMVYRPAEEGDPVDF